MEKFDYLIQIPVELFEKTGEEQYLREILDALLEKYEDAGKPELESPEFEDIFSGTHSRKSKKEKKKLEKSIKEKLKLLNQR